MEKLTVTSVHSFPLKAEKTLIQVSTSSMAFSSSRGRQRKWASGLGSILFFILTESCFFKGTRRMDAAIDAMKPFGFDEKMVTRTVTELLKVYGGQGWVFIEEHSYTVLIEALLEKQSIAERENAKQENNNNLQENLKGDDAGTSAAGESTVISSLPSSNMEAVDAALQTKHNSLQEKAKANDMDTSIADEPSVICSPLSSNMDVVRAAFQTNQIRSPSPARNESIDSAPPKDEPDAKDVSLPRGQEKPARKRRPCYGWIGDDDEDDEDFVELTPAPLPPHIAKLLEWMPGKK